MLHLADVQQLLDQLRGRIVLGADAAERVEKTVCQNERDLDKGLAFLQDDRKLLVPLDRLQQLCG